MPRSRNDPIRLIIDLNLPNLFFLSPTLPKEIVNVHSLRNVNYGLYSASTRLFKTVIPNLSVTHSCIINDSIEPIIFPDILKWACVTPIYKSGSKDKLANYRPISALPLLSKVFERCICSRLVFYLSIYNILSACQFGFRKNLSTTNALMNVVETVYAQLNCKTHTTRVSLDFSKDFDTVSNDILL